MNRDRTAIIIALVAVACAALLLTVGDSVVWLRVIVGVPFVLLLPGHAVMLYVDPEGRLGVAEWFVLAVGTSISITMLVCAGLATTVGLYEHGTIVGIAAATLVALVVASLRNTDELPRGKVPGRRHPGRRLAWGAAALLGCVLFVGLLAIPFDTTAEATQTVQLWGLPNNADGSLSIGTHNVDATSHRYTLTIAQQGQLISRQEFYLPAGTTRTFVVKRSALLTASAPVTGELVDATSAVSKRSISVWATR
ncbi:MAG: DUF1616 domain-containing protein [Coriobacteriia bacterium]|nr:DUF1616 domain-containing protein [Coriobacteriia bacterium]